MLRHLLHGGYGLVRLVFRSENRRKYRAVFVFRNLDKNYPW